MDYDQLVVNGNVNLDNGIATNTGILQTSGNVTWDNKTTFNVNLTNTSGTHPSPIAGMDYDQLVVNGNVNLDNGGALGALLTGTAAANIQVVPVGDKFTIIQATGTITGNLSGMIGATQTKILQDGSVFFNGTKFTVHYNTSSVVLTRALVNSTVTLSATPGTTTLYGQDVVDTATITPEPGAPAIPATAQVTFKVDNTSTTSPITVVSGQASFDPQTTFGVWTGGTTHTIDATFTDSTNTYATTAATQMTHTVNPDPVDIPSLVFSPAQSVSVPVYAQTQTLTATITPHTAPNLVAAVNPNGNVTFAFKQGATTVASYVVALNQATGKAVLTLPVLPQILNVGTYTVAVSYNLDNADPNYAASASPSNFSFINHKDSTTIAFNSPPTSGPMGQQATFNVTVTPGLAGSPGLPNGIVTFYDGPSTASPVLGTINPYTGGMMSFSTSSLSFGAHTISAAFTDTDGNYTNATLVSTPFTVTQAPTAVTFVSESPSSPHYGDPVTFTIHVVPSPSINASFGVPTGAVQLYLGAVTTP